MGNKHSFGLSKEQLDSYQDCSFFTKQEIKKLFSRWIFLRNKAFGDPHDESDSDDEEVNLPSSEKIARQQEDILKLQIPGQVIISMPELKDNPFKNRIIDVFSSHRNGCLTFDDFIELFSVFSAAAPRDLKAIYAFRIYDIDGDNYISKKDLQKATQLITLQALSIEELKLITKMIIREADFDSDRRLSFMEFEHVVSRAPDFVSNFTIRV